MQRYVSSVELTPSKQTERDMEAANLTAEQKAKLGRSILLSNVLVSEIKTSKKNTPRDKRAAIYNIKYRTIKYLSMKTGLGRNQLGRLEKNREQVINFLKHEDNSRTQPGKSDAKKTATGFGTKDKKIMKIHLIVDPNNHSPDTLSKTTQRKNHWYSLHYASITLVN
ncbi:hypothetical protein DPMN_077464 [Dreissena polymorpha]|uniref:Uncharacterized protein n=1 Tax=Dreissena polymorpha TaxID=45954 RepID=A0A9D3YKZ5_DREPO|nr:hypothetical protein DPMN_077464 [Dreissena polymorpha]